MTFIYIIAFGAIAFLSLSSIAKSLKKGAISYEYSKSEIKESYTNNSYNHNFKCY